MPRRARSLKTERIRTENGFSVWVTWVESMKSYVVRWQKDGGSIRQRTLQVTHHRAAEREAVRWADRLAGQVEDQPTAWAHAKGRYEAEKLPSLASTTATAWYTADSWVSRFREPSKTAEITVSYLSQLSAFMRKEGLAESSIASYLGQLRAMLGWTETIGLIRERPRFEMPHRRKRAKLMRGRPLTTEEFERLLAVADRVVGELAVPSWHHLLRGLWLSGLRISEAMQLYWDRTDKLHLTNIDGRRPVMRILDDLEKGHRDRLLPITPDFVNFLRSTPDYCRHGPVFTPLLKDGRPTRSVETAKKRIIDIGKLAQVKVDTKDKKPKYASAHDLRRSFGARWAPHVMPLVLKELMRHDAIETTEKYYTGQNAERTAAAVWTIFEGLVGEDFGEMTDERFWKPSGESSQIQIVKELTCGGQGTRTLNRQAGT